MTCHRQPSTVTWVCGHLGDKPFRRQSSRRQTNSATRVGQLGDNLFPAVYIFRVITYRHIHFGTSVVQRYHKFCDPIHSSHYNGAATHLPDGPSKPLKYCVSQTKCQSCPYKDRKTPTVGTC